MSHEDSKYHDIDPKFNLAVIIRYILASKKIDISNINDYKLLTYKEAITNLYAR